VKSLLRRRPSPAMVIALIALFVSLSGVSYGVATGFIDSREIKNNQVRSIDLRNNQVRSIDLRNNEVRGRDIRNSTIQSRDVAINAITGDDVKEDSLAKVPSALLADSATTAGSVDSMKVLDTTVAKGAGDATLVTHGPLSLMGECSDDAGDTQAVLKVDTSEDNTSAAGQLIPPGSSGANQDLDASASPFSFAIVSDSAGGNRTAALAVVHATAPSGPAFTGNVSVQSNTTSATAGTCRFQGFVILAG
jgi:hypothetical protein